MFETQLYMIRIHKYLLLFIFFYHMVLYFYVICIVIYHVSCCTIATMFINCVVYGRTSCKTALGWSVILVEYVLNKKKKKSYNRIRYFVSSHTETESKWDFCRQHLYNTISSMKMIAFVLQFHWICPQGLLLTTYQHWFGQWLGTVQATRHHLSLFGVIPGCMHTLPGLIE